MATTNQQRVRFLLLLLAVLLSPCNAARADEDATIILLIGHARDGHAYQTHEYMTECGLLAKCLEQTSKVVTRVSQGWPEDPAVLRGVDALVLYQPYGGNLLFDGSQRATAHAMLKDGVGLSAVHWSTGATGEEPMRLYLEHLGGLFSREFSTLEHIELELRRAAPEHPVSRGWETMPLFDEYYLDCRVLPEVVRVAEVEHNGRTHPIGWVYERPGQDGGRSFGLVAGHYHDNFKLEAFRRLIVNGILWTAHRDIPEGGAPCAATDADLELPPPPGRDAD